MNAPGILSGIVFALVASMIGSLFFTLLPVAFSTIASLQITLTILSATYLSFLIKKGRQRTGRVITFIAWILISSGGLFLDLPIIHFILSQVAMIWIVRSIVFHSSILPSLFDLGLIAIGLLAASWAMLQTGSLATALWCFFLVQSLFGYIPGMAVLNRDRPPENQTQSNQISLSKNRFQSAHRVAMDAIQKLTTH